MVTFIVRRILVVGGLVVGLTLIVFGVVTTVSPEARVGAPNLDPALSPTGISQRYGFDQPFLAQYVE